MVIALTGGIGTGKSTIGKMLLNRGIPIIDTDLIAREVIEYPNIILALVKLFGNDILLENKIDRKKLAQKVFGDKKKVEMLNSIMHPAILKKMWEEVEKKKKTNKFVVVDIPLLFEIKFEDKFDKILLVYAPKNIQLERIIKRDNRTKEEAENIINSQINIEEKKKKSDYVINNTESIENSEKQLEKIIKEWEKF